MADRKEEEIVESLRSLIDEVLPNVPTQDVMTRPFLEMGANSLVLMELQKTVEERWGLQLKLPMFFEDLTNLDSLVNYIHDHGSIDSTEATADLSIDDSVVELQTPDLRSHQVSLHDGMPSDQISQLMKAQIQGASDALNSLLEKQLAFLATVSGDRDISRRLTTQAKPTLDLQKESSGVASDHSVAELPAAVKTSPRPQMMLKPLEIRARGLNVDQQAHLEDLIDRYTKKTRNSKKLAAASRDVLADSRASVGFRFTTKEMLYPIVGDRASGSRIWDVDGNEYVDITMGQGVSLFGHHPSFVDNALRDRPVDAMELGPRPPEAAEAAQLVAELTGMDRVTFTNSGTEAVMAAIRLARASTGRDKIVIFQGSYHGHADNVMGVPHDSSGRRVTRPASAGIPGAAVQDLIILEYGDDSSLEEIRKLKGQLAAVLVEPVQSRRPDLQPQSFLKELRKVTREIDTLLIFDEMITGFRIHQQGAQGWFGVDADIATYGKVVGGGMPIGVVAGRDGLMDPIDGGRWSYGDSTFPSVERVIFGGTFCQHPLVMTSALATLRHLKQEGPSLQEKLNCQTERLKRALNEFFVGEEMPISIVNFGSLFRFDFKENLELLFYHLMEKGVFIWEWRNYFLSTAHSEADIEFVIQKIRESALALRDGDFLGKTTPAINPVSQDQLRHPIEPLRMSRAQEQLYTLSRISSDASKVYQVGATVTFSGTMSLDRLQMAFQKAVLSNPSLNLVVNNSSGQLSEVKSLPELKIIDGFGDDQDDDALQAWIDKPLDFDFDLETGPLIKGLVVRVGKEKLILRIVGHHFAIDGISMNLLFRQIIDLYDNPESIDRKARSGLQDYLSYFKEQNLDKERAFWKRQLKDLPEALLIPSDCPPPVNPSFEARRFLFRFDPADSLKLKEKATANQCTGFMYFFALYSFWLNRLTEVDDFVVGVPVAGRMGKIFSDTIGYFTHLMPVRVNSKIDDEKIDFMAEVRRTLLEGYEHQNLPYSEIMEAINGRGDSLHHDPILSVIFNFDEPGELAHPADVNISWCPTVAGYTAFGLTCNVTVSENAYFVELLFPSDRVSQDLAKSLGDSFIKTITEVGALGVAGARQTDIASATDIERQYLNFENGSALPVPISVVSGIESTLKIHSDRVAIVANDNTRTFKKLDDQSARIAKYLAGATLLPGSRVIVCAEHSSDVIAAMLGVLRAGFVLVPVDPALPDDRKSWIQKDCQAKIVLTDSDSHFPGFLVDGSGVVQNIAECNTHENDSLEVRVSEIQGTDPAYILYTSGSTGLPKGVVISHSAFANYVSWAAQFYELSRGSGAIFHGSISFDATLTSIFPPLIAGQRILIPQSSQDPIAGVVGLLREGAEISLLKVTPAHLELLNAALGHEVPDQAVRVLVIGGEALKASAVSPWLEPNCTTRVINEYGPTETVVGCCVYEIPRIKLIESSLPIGRPIPNTGLRVVDSSGRMLPTGVAGELFIYGSGVGIKYLNQDDLTERKFKMLPANPHSCCDKETVRGYFSGDRVRWSDQGELHYLGRTDGQILLRGFRIEPEEIENALNQLTGISQSGVVVQKHDEGDSRLVAFVAMESETAMDSDEIRRQLATLVPGYMVPASFLRVKNLPLTSTGKINRSALGEIEADIIQTSATMEGANDSVEVEASRIWKELLKVDLIPLDANFFDLGGHSILAVKLIDRLNHYFSCDLKPIDIYQSPTVRLISGLIREGKNDSVDRQIPERMSRRGDVSRSKRNRAFNSKASAR